MRDSNFSSNTFVTNQKKNDNYFEESLKDLRRDIDDETKIEMIGKKIKEIMEILGLDLQDDSLKDSPGRIAKMYIKEIFSGLNEKNKPSITLFRNNYNYDQMLVEKDITLFSTCEHHFVPIIGKAHVAYFSNGNVIGLSKLNRIVNYYAKRPQVQERLTKQIAEEIMSVLETNDVAILIEADHLCVQARGVEDIKSKTVTSSYNGKFLNQDTKIEFLNYIKS